jgi:F0F1-type ATP synthase membrane subunit c/vacuolar-type H+-ATPase subunit K
VGIGSVFGALIVVFAGEPVHAGPQPFVYTGLVFALTEAIALFGLMVAFLFLFD